MILVVGMSGGVRMLEQVKLSGWSRLGDSLYVDGSESVPRSLVIQVHYSDSQYAEGFPVDPLYRMMGVDAVRIRCSSCGGEDEEPVDEEPPSRPRNMRLVRQDSPRSGYRYQYVISVDPPADSGGGPVTGYRFTFARAGRGGSFVRSVPRIILLTKSATRYTVSFSAVNEFGTSDPITPAFYYASVCDGTVRADTWSTA